MNKIIQKLKSNSSTSFQEVINYIDENYLFTPTGFKNGNQYNEAGQNNGSCKVFAYAQLNNLSKEDTLLLFAEHYQSVLNTPKATEHQNIRNFIELGWEAIKFEGVALKEK